MDVYARAAETVYGHVGKSPQSAGPLTASAPAPVGPLTAANDRMSEALGGILNEIQRLEDLAARMLPSPQEVAGPTPTLPQPAGEVGRTVALANDAESLHQRLLIARRNLESII